MRKIYISVLCGLLLVLLVLLDSCTDTIFSSLYSGEGISLEVAVAMSGDSPSTTRALSTRASGENAYDNGLDENTELQYAIGEDDIYVLVFAQSGGSTDAWTLYAVPSIYSMTTSADGTERDLTCILSRPESSITILVDVVANLAQNAVYSSAAEANSALTNMIGSTREEVYASIGSFSCPANSSENPYGVWTLDAADGGRYLPMWGQSYVSSMVPTLQTYTITPTTNEVIASCGLYRSVAKLGVTIDNSCETFQLREIYVYYPNDAGTFVSLPTDDNWTADRTVQFTLPAVPDAASTRSIEYPLVYKWEAPLGAGGQYLNNIYLAEADNKNAASDPVCLVVGGYYLGGDYNGEGLSDDDYPLDYYRIDLSSSATSGTTLGADAFDLIRNHSYIFNILNANNPGTSDPDPRRAAAGLTVEILDYTDVPMHGINSQYTLNVNQSLFTFEGATTDVGQLIISTDGSAWELVTEWTTAEGYPEDGATPDWVTVTDVSGHTSVDDVVTIEPDANVNDSEIRSGSFWIKCNEILKRINIVQDVTETGNAYVVSAGTYDLKVDTRGNGNIYAWEDETGESTEDISFGMGADIDDVAYVAIIWETADGFITIPDPTAISASGSIAYVVNDVSLDSFGDWSGNVFDPGNGANALIGVYNSKDELVWTFHIWALGDYADGAITEQWRVGTSGNRYYDFMDRNLGAYSNLPGSKSFGLLYQWGRKDPFIGAYRENNERDYRQVRKQYTRHYEQPNGTTYVWSLIDDSTFGNSYDGEKSLEQYIIQNPTTILEDGLLSSDHTDETAHGLWGTTSYNYDTSESGNKTMYDPCPPGFRVPSLNALTIYDGQNDMWTGNSGGTVQHSAYTARYVPIKEGDSYRTQSQNTADFISDAPFYGFWFDYSGDAGYASTYANDNAESYGFTYYDSTTLANGTCGWPEGYSNTNPGKPNNVTWLPLAGIYNGTVNHFGRAGLTDRMGSEPYLPASSLQVSSVLWANSPTSTNTNYPAGLLLHGTEGAYAPLQSDGSTTYQYSPGTVNGIGTGTGTSSTVATDGPGYWTTATTGYSSTASGWWSGSVDAKRESMDPSIEAGQWNASSGNERILDYDNWRDQNGLAGGGRHFHSYADPTISTLANPSYAASVRCIRDKDAVVRQDDVVYNADGTVYDGTPLDLYEYGVGGASGTGQDYIELSLFFVETWEVVTPGAKWVSISPSSGSSDKTEGDTEVIRVSYNTTAGEIEVGSTATIVIRFARGDTAEINITYVGGTRRN